jgi:diguanylate cyclase (GGDEF)-like protein/PAS domain S-box-containing protein
LQPLYFTKEYMENTKTCVIILNQEKKIENVNPAFHDLLGYTSEEIIGKNMDLLSDRKRDVFYRKMWETVENVGLWEGEIWNRRKNGELFLEKRTIIKNNEQYIFLLEEVKSRSDKNKKEKRDREDHVTNLPSRSLFQDKFKEVLINATALKKKPAIVMINIDRFQEIDKTFGFTIGDPLLKEVTIRMMHHCDAEVITTRMVGGMFIMLLPDVKKETVISDLLENILEDFRKKPFFISKQEVFISLSMGISLFPADGEDEKELLRNADFARYRAMEIGENNFQFYTPNLNVQMFERLVLETQLRKAVEKNEFVLYFQPQIECKSDMIVGAEALIRWKHPEMGIVPPVQFISLAEETGLINSIGIWVIEEVCRHLNKWDEMGLPNLVIGLNLSSKQLQNPLFVGQIKEIVTRFHIDPSRIDLEITESMLMFEIDKAIEMLKELKRFGFRISIDDFGTGYSSLSYLAKLPIDTLKIDRSFIQNAEKNKENMTIVSIVMAMAHELNLEVIAEGVETEEQYSFLQRIACDYYQGYYYKPPVPTLEFETIFLKKN